MSTANNTQVGGQHYKAKTIQPWDFIAANGLGSLDDLRKARHYLDKLIDQAVVSLREADQVATRETVADITALKLSVVDDRLRAVKNAHQLHTIWMN